MRQQLGLPERLAEQQPSPVPVNKRITKWGFVSDDDLRQVVGSSSSQAEILGSLGLSLAKGNYIRLRSRADQLGIELPGKWGADPKSKRQDQAG